MALDTDTMQKIMIEVDLGVPDSESKVPSTPEVEAFRAKMHEQIADINAKGGRLHFTPEAVDLD